MRSYGLVACVLMLVLTSSGSPVVAAQAARPGPQARTDGAADKAAAGIRTVTLVTGDKVVLQELDGPDRIVTVRPGKGRTGMAFRRWVQDGDIYVIPADAGKLIAAKRVDRRLFNVSKLVEFGYDDGRVKTVPLIVARPGGSKALRSLGAGPLEVSKADTATFWRGAARDARIWLDGPVRATLDRSAAQIGAPTAWQLGHKGAGAVVAVLDTGIDAKHPDLADGAVIGERDFSESETGTADLFGHGTHVAGIITGNGAASGGKYAGIAPDAKLLNGKVLADFGGGRESWIIAGMEWAAAEGATGTFDWFFVRPSATAATVGTFTFGLAGLLARPDGQGGFAESPYLYHAEWTHDARVPSDLHPRIRDRDLAKVQTQIAAAAPEEKAAKDWLVQRETPAVLTEYFTPGTSWYTSMVLNFDPENLTMDGVLASAPVTYRLGGKPVVEQWNMGVFGPAFPPGSLDAPFASRLGDQMQLFLPLFSDQPPSHQGDTRVGTTLMTLSRNGEVVGESPDLFGFFDVPAGAGDYRVAITSTRPSTLSTQVSAAWTFKSGTVAGDEPKPLPVMAVRFAPGLDRHNRAKAGRPLVIPVAVQQHEDSGMGSLRRLDVEVFYDDGGTWRRVPVFGFGLHRLALVAHPAGGGFVSLRARAADTKGNAVEQTIIRAYAIAE